MGTLEATSRAQRRSDGRQTWHHKEHREALVKARVFLDFTPKL